MRTWSWTCLWPGLAALWVRGRWGGLLTAAAFAGLLNFALIATLAGDLLPIGGVSRSLTAVGVWTLVLGFWVLGVRSGRRELSGSEDSKSSETDAWLREAQTHYLKAHWIEAETLLAKMLVQRPAEVEARLLLATILRRTGQTAEARRRLTELASEPAATGWKWEIDRELARIAGGADNSNEAPRKAA